MIHLRVEIMSNIQQVVSPPPTPTGTRKLSTKSSEKLKYVTAALKNVELHLMLDNGKLLTIKIDDFQLNSNRKEMTVKSDLVKFEFDQNVRTDSNPIFLLRSAQVSLIESDAVTDQFRLDASQDEKSSLTSKTNRVLRLRATLADLHFPFKYCFNDTFEHVIATFKMVKNIYKKHSEPFHPDSRLPPDLQFKIDQWSWTIEDDPFEVQLASVFRFKEREYWDREIRRNLLIRKIKELDEDFGTIADDQYNVFFDDLDRANTHTYITKIKKLKAEKLWSKYKNLFSWNVKNFDLTLLADQSMNGYEKMAAIILQIDPALRESNIDPWDYTTLWGRQILLQGRG